MGVIHATEVKKSMKGVATNLRSDGKALGKSINPDAATAGQRR